MFGDEVFRAGVDLIRDAEGRLQVLELNGLPAWHGLQSVCPKQTDITQLLVDDMLLHAETRA